MTIENVGQVYGVVLSLALAYFPKLSAWYATLESVKKSQVMVLSIFGGLVVVFALSCFGLSVYGVMCTVVSAVDLLKVLINIAIANQAAYFLIVRPYKK